MNQIFSISLFNVRLTRQLFYFGIIGVLAAFVHMSIVVLLVETKLMLPLTANIIAFLCSFNVSYFGHRYFTFATTKTQQHHSLPRFFIVASSSFILNETLFFYLLKFFYYPVALFLVLLLVAIFTFSFSKLWAFR